MPVLRVLALLVSLPLILPLAADAATVYDTYALADGDVDAIVGQFEGSDLQLAYPFELPPGTGPAPLDFVRLRLRHSPDAALGKGDYVVRLREDEGGEPGAVLESWTYTDILNSETDVDFDSVDEPILFEGQTYWLNVAMEPESGAGLWIAADPRTSDLLFANTGVVDPTWLTPPNPYLIGVALVELPEPSHAWLALAGAAVLAPFRRRRARA